MLANNISYYIMSNGKPFKSLTLLQQFNKQRVYNFIPIDWLNYLIILPLAENTVSLNAKLFDQR